MVLSTHTHVFALLSEIKSIKKNQSSAYGVILLQRPVMLNVKSH